MSFESTAEGRVGVDGAERRLFHTTGPQTEYVNGDGKHFEHLFLLKKVFALTAFALL